MRGLQPPKVESIVYNYSTQKQMRQYLLKVIPSAHFPLNLLQPQHLQMVQKNQQGNQKNQPIIILLILIFLEDYQFKFHTLCNISNQFLISSHYYFNFLSIKKNIFNRYFINQMINMQIQSRANFQNLQSIQSHLHHSERTNAILISMGLYEGLYLSSQSVHQVIGRASRARVIGQSSLSWQEWMCIRLTVFQSVDWTPVLLVLGLTLIEWKTILVFWLNQILNQS
ncbi:unnamed protein product [Paramecium octaurelia]|uniref:Transmembrane protein n=1 Tax=Paramecium octaurelia TaxID=43137 RepID=A0A8S1YD85_PAROT|nr:unnamed protein product [Paramecium octaurelia]CAD8214424.1 unnamed protein product [Paramecium octaurelia]